MNDRCKLVLHIGDMMMEFEVEHLTLKESVQKPDFGRRPSQMRDDRVITVEAWKK